MRKLSKIISILLITTILAGTFLACSSEEKEESKLTKVVIALDWSPSSNHTGIYLAKNLGYFKELGIEIELIDASQTGAESIVASGAADFGIAFQDSYSQILAGDDPMPITAIAALIQHNTSGIVSLKENNIVSPKDMAGKTYATWEWDIEQAIIKQLVTNDGGNYDDIKMIPTYVENIIAALQSDIDTVWIYWGWDGAALQNAGIETNFIRISDMADELDYYSPILIANNDYLAKNEETTKKLLQAMKKGYEYAIENPDKAAEIFKKEVPELDLDMLKIAQNYLADEYKAEVKQWGYIDTKRWDAFFTWAYDNGVLQKKIASGEGFTNKYLPE